MTYSTWLAEVGRKVQDKVGMTLDEMPDLTDLGGLYASNVTATDAANAVILDQGLDEEQPHYHWLDDLPGSQGYYPF